MVAVEFPFKPELSRQDGQSGFYFDYPTGSDIMPDGLDYSGDPTFEAVFWDGGEQPQPNNVDNAGLLSPYGTMGQGGNVFEWSETAAHTYYPVRFVHGGGWSYYTFDASYLVPWPFPFHEWEETDEMSNMGFRVASIVPEPSTITLLLCALVCMALIRRR